jgi:hypothetical protein
MTSPNDPGILFAHTFSTGRPLRGVFATSQGRYTLSALDDACALSLDLGPNAVVDVLLTLESGSSCSLAVVRRGRLGDPGPAKPDDAVLITNHDVGAGTPRIEPAPSAMP